MNPSDESRQRLLRLALLGNASFSSVSGILILLFQSWILRFLGLSKENNLLLLGAGLLVFALLLLLTARRPVIKLTDAWIAVFMDLAWVLGSYALLFVAPFSSGGKWLVAIVAEFVLLFAGLQWLGIRRIKKSAQFA